MARFPSIGDDWSLPPLTRAQTREGLAEIDTDGDVVNGAGEKIVGTSDAAVDAILTTPDGAARTSLLGTIDTGIEPVRARAVEPLPLLDVTVTPRDGRPIPAEFFHGHLWGVTTDGGIHRSGDGGTTWEAVATAPGGGTIQRLIPTADGEMLAVFTDRVVRSTGWATVTPTWATVLTNPTPSYFYPWGIDGDGTKFVIVHYSGSGTQTPDRADSRYGWISLDGGLTWTVKWDVVARFGTAVNALTHIHGAAYDPWEDRFFISEGHVSATGVYVSYDDGDTWALVPYGDTFDVSPANSPTTITPTDHGVVFGSDDPTNGVMVLPRGAATIERAWSQMGISNSVLLGYAHMGARDPRTGIVYQVWENNATSAAGLGTKLTASDGQVAGQVWASDPAMYLWRRIAIDDQGNLLAWEQATDSLLRAKVSLGGARPTPDDGRVLGGTVAGGRGSVAVGAEAVAVGDRSVAIGGGASTSAHDGLAVGGQAQSIGSGMALGRGSSADPGGTAVGYLAIGTSGLAVGHDARTRNAASTAIGRGARATTDADGPVPNATAVGRDAKASAGAGNTIAAGYQATASGARATALGSQSVASLTDATAVGQTATASASYTVALGKGAAATHSQSVAIGCDTSTTAANQVAVGPRDVEVQDAARGLVLRSPDGTRHRVTVGDDGTLTTAAL